nr:MAG TPA: hypothetical protein [Caudoviricetes sp.]
MACETLGEERKPLSYGYYPTSLAQCPHNYAIVSCNPIILSVCFFFSI